MKNFLIAATLAFATTAASAPPPANYPATTPAATTASAPASGLTPECREKVRAHAEKMKQELALTDAQAAALRNEAERYHGTLLTARADHRDAVAKILTPEQLAKMEGKRSEMRRKRMEACGADMDDDDGSRKSKHKEKH